MHASQSPPRSTRSANVKKSTPQPLETASTLSPQSSQILNNLLRANSGSFPTIEVPASVGNRRSPRASLGTKKPTESLHEALARLSANEEEERNYPPTEVDNEESAEPDDAPSPVLTQTSPPDKLPTASPQLALDGSRASTPMPGATKQPGLEPSLSSIQGIRKQPSVYNSDLASADVSIQNFLDTMSQSSHHPPAMIFSFPTSAVPSLEEGAHRLGLFVHVLSLASAKEEWVPVVIGKDANAIEKLLQDSEKLAQAVRQSGTQIGGDFRLGMSHIVVGTLGVMATWAGLAYS